MRPSLIEMGVWCASATDVQPRERKTGCAWTDDREFSDALTRRRFPPPLDKGLVNGGPLSRGGIRLSQVRCRRLVGRTRPVGVNLCLSVPGERMGGRSARLISVWELPSFGCDHV